MRPISSRSAPLPSRLRFRPQGGLLCLMAGVMAVWLASGAVRAAERIDVSDTAGLISALRAAQGGEVIVLADGDYGDINLNGTKGKEGRFGSTVTVTSATPQAARISGIRLSAVTNLAFDAITLQGKLRALSSSNLAVTNSRVVNDEGMSLSFRATDGVTVSGNHITGGDYGVNFYSVANFRITENRIEKALSDLIQISRASYGGLIENNVLYDVQVVNPKAHPDLIQIFGYDGLNPRDITIRGNYLYDDPETGINIAQGIFLANPTDTGFRNILIEENLVSVRSPNSIFISGGQENVIIRHNSLIAGPERYKGGTIRLAGKPGAALDNSGVTVMGNIASGILDQVKVSRLGQNMLYGPYTKSPFRGAGASWQDFILRHQPSKVNATMGANATLERLGAAEETARN